MKKLAALCVIFTCSAFGQALMGLGPVPYNPWGVAPTIWNTNGPSVFGSAANCMGDKTLITDNACYPTRGRVLTVSGLTNGSAVDGYAIGIDLHPSLTATANNQHLVGLWVDPQIYNSGSSGFNCLTYVPCGTAGIVNIQSLEQRGYVMAVGDIVGLENGGKAATGGDFEYKILGIGNVRGVAPQSYDLSSSNGHGLVGVEILPTFKNTALVPQISSGQYGEDIKVSSQSTVLNHVAQQVGIHIQNGIEDANTLIDVKKAMLIERQTGGVDDNYGVYDLNLGYFDLGVQSPLYTPSSSSATCKVGTARWDANYIYLCVSPNYLKRVMLQTF